MRTLNEIFKIEREVNFSIGENCFLARMDGGLILLSEDVMEEDAFVGAPCKKIFTFKCVSAGMAAIQFGWVGYPGAPLLYEQVMPVQIAETDTQFGGWSDMHEVTNEEMAVFRMAMGSLKGVDYTPLRVSKQVVKGMNYKFVCEAKVVAPGAEKYYAMVYIYDAPDVPREIDPIVTKIVPFLK